MCLTQGTIEKDPRQGSPECLNQWSYKDWPKRPSDHRLQEAGKKDSDRAITPAAEAVHVPTHLVLRRVPQAKQLHHLHAQLSLGQSCHNLPTSYTSCRLNPHNHLCRLCVYGIYKRTLRAPTKIFHLCMQGCFSHVQLFVTM